MTTKTIVYLKSGKKLAYDADGNDLDVMDRWRTYLISTVEGTIMFGRFVCPKSEIEYVEVLP